MPALAPFAFPALPADLLRTRPDVQAAEAAVRKAAAEVGVARSELYPRIAITGSLLYAYNLTRNRRTTSDNVPAIGPTIDIPLLDWGRRRMQVDAQQEALQAAELSYQRTVRSAVAEAEGALSALAAQQNRADALAQARPALAERVRAADVQARLGLASEYDGLAAQRGPAGRSRMGHGAGRALAGVRRAVQGAGRRSPARGTARRGHGCPPEAPSGEAP